LGVEKKIQFRRRALTDIDELIDNDLDKNEGRPLAVENLTAKDKGVEKMSSFSSSKLKKRDLKFH